MGKYNLVIAESDSQYLNNLMNYISQNYGHVFNTICFTEKTYLDEHINKADKLDIILMNKDFYNKDFNSYDKTSVIILSENLTEFEGFPCLKKYQSADKICTDIIRIYESSINNNYKKNNGTKVITFYSPLGGIGTSTIAVTTAYNIAKKGEKVLYLSLEDIQSTEIFMGNIKATYNLSDLISSVKERSEEFKSILTNGCQKYKKSSLYYFNPVDSILDIEDLSLEDIRELVEKIEELNVFDYVIFDLQSVLNTKYYHLFKKSIKVIVTIGQDKRSNYKIDTMLKQLDETENFIFIVNKFEEDVERLVPKLIANGSSSIIGTIPFDEKIKDNYDFYDYVNSSPDFAEKVDNIVRHNILMS